MGRTEGVGANDFLPWKKYGVRLNTGDFKLNTGKCNDPEAGTRYGVIDTQQGGKFCLAEKRTEEK